MSFPARLHPRLAVAGAAALIAVAALSGCSADSLQGEQSKADACGVVAEGLSNVQEQVSAADTALTTGDVLTVQENLASASAGLNSIAPQVTNPEIAPILADLTTGLDNVRASVTDVDQDDAEAATEALQSSADDLQSAAQRFNEACGS